MKNQGRPRVLELCAGAGGQAIGLEMAGFEAAALVEFDKHACGTLKLNRPEWDIRHADVKGFDASGFKDVDLVAAGVPCPPFSIAGRQLGENDERDLFPAALKIVAAVQPKAVLFENVRGFASPKFENYRDRLEAKLKALGYQSDYRVVNSSDFGVPQLRPRFVWVALRHEYAQHFVWPHPSGEKLTVGGELEEMLGAKGWRGAKRWAKGAMKIAPTIVGGSKKHGGPDLGPTRAKREWLALGVNGAGVANEPPSKDQPVDYLPKLTVEMVARIQGFPPEWKFSGGKTASYRQVGNAFPPPVAAAIGRQIALALSKQKQPLLDSRQLPEYASSLLAPTA